jgi:hypothetical protein
MLDFCEAVGKAITDAAFREALYAALPDVASTPKNDYAVVFSESDYKKIHKFLEDNVSPGRFSYSLAVCGEAMRVLGGFRDDIEALAALNLQVPAHPDCHLALGAMTVDMGQRQLYVDDGGLGKIGGAPIAAFRAALDEVVVNEGFLAASNKLCEDAWARGCIIRLVPYPDHMHPDPNQWNFAPAAATA